MKIRYSGNRDGVTKSRMAVISFDPNNDEELRVANVIRFLKNIGWKGFDWFDDCVVIGMKNRAQYDEFLIDYKDEKSLFL